MTEADRAELKRVGEVADADTARFDERRPAHAQQQTDLSDNDSFFIVLLASLGFVIAVGATIGIQLHSPRSLLVFVACFASAVSAAPYLAYRRRLPSSRLIVWPVQAVVFLLSVGIPVAIWILLIGPGGLAHEVLTFLSCATPFYQTCGN